MDPFDLNGVLRKRNLQFRKAFRLEIGDSVLAASGTNTNYDENTMTLYVTGGGSCLVKNFYKFSTDRVKFVEDICAAAKGYEYLTEAQMKSEAKK